MQTNTWMPAPATETQKTQRRPGWLEVLGWYFAGGFVTAASWTIIGAIGQVMSAAVASMAGQVMLIGGIVLLVRQSRSLPRRSRIALFLGVITPFVLAALVVVYVLWALAHSNWQF